MLQPHKKFWKQIMQFNSGIFIAAGIITAACIIVLLICPLPLLLKWVLVIIIAGTVWFSAGSLFFSYLVYDRSDLYRFAWLKSYLSPGKKLFNIYSGYSDGGHLLNNFIAENNIVHFDFFDRQVSVTGSIKKAQELSVPLESTLIIPGDLRTDEKADVILFMQSLHELRTKELKISMLKESAAHLLPGGIIIIAEHLCNLNNFIIYGPGAFHFFSKRHWADVIRSAGLIPQKKFTITLFINVYILKIK